MAASGKFIHVSESTLHFTSLRSAHEAPASEGIRQRDLQLLGIITCDYEISIRTWNVDLG
jgi:hypothetical protein